MAIVPYERQVRQAPTPGVRVSTDAPEVYSGRPGAAITHGAQNLAQALTNAQDREAERADEIRLSEERRALNDFEYQNVYDPKTGAMSKMGKNAFGTPEEVGTNYDKFVTEREKGLSTERQKQAYRALAGMRRDHVMRNLYQHVGQQSKVVEASEIEAGIESSKERAAMDPRNAQTELGFVGKYVGAKVQSRGLDEKAAALELRVQQSDLHKRVILRLAETGKDQQASDYFTANKESLHDNDLKIASNAVDGASRLGTASRLVAEAFTPKVERKSTTFGMVGGDWTVKTTPAVQTMEEFNATLPKDLDPKTREIAKDLARQQFTDQARSEQQRQDSLFKKAWETIKAGGVVDPVTMQGLDPQGEKAIATYAKMKANGAKRDRSEPLVFAGFYSQTPEQLRALTLEQMDKKIRPWMTEDDYEAAAKHWGAAHKDPEAFKSILKEDEEMLEGYKKSGASGIKMNDTMKTIEKDEDKSSGFMKFKQAVDAERKRVHTATGKNPDDAKFKEIVQKTAYTMAKEVNVVDYAAKDVRAVMNEFLPFFGYVTVWSTEQKKKLIELSEEDIKARVIEMPWEFRQKMYNYVHGTPGGMETGRKFQDWENANRARVNAAYLAFELGAPELEVYKIVAGK